MEEIQPDPIIVQFQAQLTLQQRLLDEARQIRFAMGLMVAGMVARQQKLVSEIEVSRELCQASARLIEEAKHHVSPLIK